MARIREEAGGPGRLDYVRLTQKVIRKENLRCLAHSLNAVYTRKALVTFPFHHAANRSK